MSIHVVRTGAPSVSNIEQAMGVLLCARAALSDDADLVADEQHLFDYLASDPQTCEEAEIISRLIRALRAAEAQERATDAAFDDIAARRSRWRERVAFLRGQTQTCMEALGIRKIVLPDATARIQAGRLSVQIIDEEKIPAEFFRVQRELRKTPIKEAIESGREVPGAVLGNAAPVLVITTT